MIRTIILFLLASAALVAQDPRVVAEDALVAWRAGDTKRLDAVAHPEFKKRLREARIVQFYIEDKPAKKRIVESGSDSEVVAIFCEALRGIVPYDAHVEYFDRFIETRKIGDLTVAVFESGWRSKANPSSVQSWKIEVILKKADGEWRFLWSPAAQIHVDLTWDPR